MIEINIMLLLFMSAQNPTCFPVTTSVCVNQKSIQLHTALISHSSKELEKLFRIQVVDEETGHGVPLVELRMTNDVVYYTDSSGNAAIDEPSLIGKTVHFALKSHGYEFPADGFGYRGVAILLKNGGGVTLKIRRLNIAERLYRLTGEGIYRDTAKLGLPLPTKFPLLNAGVVGQDSVLMTSYHGKFYWFWGDTSQAAYPLGNFRTTGATSEIPTKPEIEINFSYFADSNGFTKKMFPIPGEGPVWVSGVTTVDSGAHLISFYSRVQGLEKTLEKGLAVFNDGKTEFEPVMKFDETAPMPLSGHPFTGVSTAKDTRSEAMLFGVREGSDPYPFIRVPAKLEALKNLKSYEAYTCVDVTKGVVERDLKGDPIYRWRPGGAPLDYEQTQKLLKSGVMKPEQSPYQLRDIVTGKTIIPATGSVYWNDYRKRWVMILQERFGSSSLVGEIWFAEADTPVGPWVYAAKIVTHDKYDFYNPTQHPEFDAEGGKRIYFEGTYVNTFSGNPVPTPRYNYNQILYALNLQNKRLDLPMPVYRLDSGEFRTKRTLKISTEARHIADIPFFALPPTSSRTANLIAIKYKRGGWEGLPIDSSEKPDFYAVASSHGSPELFPLKNSRRDLLGYVWKNPNSSLILDFEIAPMPHSPTAKIE